MAYQVVREVSVALGVTADPELPERVAGGLEFLEQVQGVGERAIWSVAIAGDDECAADAGAAEPVDGIGQVLSVAEHPGGQVRGDGVPTRSQALCQLDGWLYTL